MRHVLPLLISGVLAAQGTASLQPVTAGTAVDNAWVKVRRLAFAVGQELPLHEHPEHVVVAISPVAIEEVVEGGKPTQIMMKAGEIRHFPALRHRVKGLAKEPMDMLLIELKPGAPATTGMDATGAQDDPKQAKVEFSNDHLRILRWHIAPRGTSTHGHANHVVVFLSAGHATVTPEGGAAKDLVTQPGDAKWLDSQRHTIVNLTDKAAEAVTIELRPKGK
jgi:quercetin dioxygenase-like cupin family protein